jgi:hypothetical protein
MHSGDNMLGKDSAVKGFAVFLFVVLAVNFMDLSVLGRFYIDEPFERGSVGSVYVNVRNPSNEKIEDVNVRVFIYDLGEFYTSNSFDVAKRDSTVAHLFMPIPKAMYPGDYLAKISVSNDQLRDTQHVFIQIN